jgi:HEAT repeat protein
MAAKPIRTPSRLIGAFLFALSLHCAQAQQSLEQPIQKLSNADPDVRGEALRALQAMPSSIVVPKILDALKTADHDSATRLVKVLVSHPDPSEIKPLIALAKKYDGLGSEVFAVLGVDGARGLLAAVPENCKTKVETEFGTKEFFVWAGETASSGGQAARVVLKQQTKANDACVRLAALYGVAAINQEASGTDEDGNDSAKTIVSCLADSDPEVAQAAIELLKPQEGGGGRYRRWTEDFAAQNLIEFFKAQKVADIRERVLAVLAQYGDEPVQGFMNGLATDSDPHIVEIAKKYAPPVYEEDRVSYSDSPASGITPPEKVAEIERLRGSSDVADRVAAAEEMAKSGDVVYTAGLIELLKDPSLRVRARAAKGLGELNGYFEDASIRSTGNREDSAPALFASLNDRSATVRAEAINSLASLYPDNVPTEEIPANHREVLEKLRSLTHDKNTEVTKQAALAYNKFLLPEDIAEAVKSLKSTDQQVRSAAAEAIQQSKSPAGVKPLVGLLKDPDVAVRCDASRLLWVMVVLSQDSERPALAAELEAQPLAEALQDPTATKIQIMDLLAASHDPAAMPIFLKALMESKGYSPETAIRVIRASGRPDTPQILLTILRSGNYSGGYSCLQALLALKDPSVEQPLLDFAKTPEGKWINQDQVQLAFHDPRLVDTLLVRLKDKDEPARTAAAKMLSEYRDERIVPALITALKDESWPVQYAAAESLGKLGDSHAASALIAMLDYNPGAAALALGDLHRAEALPKLAALLANPKVPYQKEIVAGMAKMPDAPAAEALTSFVEHTDKLDCDLETIIVQTLANLKDARVVPALQKINFDGWKANNCYFARTTAAQALANRGARPFPEEMKD